MVIKYGTEPDAAKRLRKHRGKLIRDTRNARGMSVEEFAQQLGVTVGAVSHWETGRFTPRPDKQLLIAQVLNVPWSLLFGLDGQVA